MGQASHSTNPQVLLAPGFYAKDISSQTLAERSKPLAAVTAALLTPGHVVSIHPSIPLSLLITPADKPFLVQVIPDGDSGSAVLGFPSTLSC